MKIEVTGREPYGHLFFDAGRDFGTLIRKLTDERNSERDRRELAEANLRAADARIAELVKLAGDAVSEVAHLRQAYATSTYNHPDDDMRILTLNMSEALIMRGCSILGWPAGLAPG